MNEHHSTTGAKRGRFLIWSLILSFIVLVILLYTLYTRFEPNRNKLAYGEESGLIGTHNLQLNAPIELDFKSKSEIFLLRREAVEQYPDLILKNYSPSTDIFGQIVDGLPWWGINGQFYYGNGEQSIAGPAEESRFILNPYLLIAAEPWRMWDKNLVSEATTHRADFLYVCPPTWLEWRPSEAYAEVTYSAHCASALNYRYFDLISYNARDFNLNYIYVSYADSQNITKRVKPTEAYEIPHYIHRGGSCGYPGGCNNMSPPTPEIDGLEIIRYPFKVVIWLWEKKPDSVEETPDMVFVVQFK